MGGGDEDPLQPVTSDETVSVGGTVTLTCRVAESDSSSLQWSNTAQQTLYFGEKRALRDNRIQLHHSTSTELSITISDVQLSDEGEYTCSIFTMPVRTARATVTVLGVPGKPQISGFESAVPEGGKVTLTCTSTGSKPPARLIWFHGDQQLEDSPIVEIQPDSNLPREGEKFNLKCSGKGNPEPTSYIWEKKDGELPSLAKVDGASLHFEMLNKSDNGVYLCHGGGGGVRSGPGGPGVPDPTAMLTSSGVDHAVIGGVVAVIVFILLCLLIVLGRYLIRHKGTYLTHEAKGSDDAPDADTAIINAEGGTSGAEDKKEYYI
ncbi:putative cell adhesion molecule 3 [Scophthalmus maximus]|uniref:Putative cell adhesion molecule 3 n=1 Tax=Scophthalmus maximus TaxID=52904 RepID=A0A2U9BIJ5_SCOMX|nr:putative cell adhesion molecule 3 [Scophthalmus maximus]